MKELFIKFVVFSVEACIAIPVFIAILPFILFLCLWQEIALRTGYIKAIKIAHPSECK